MKPFGFRRPAAACWLRLRTGDLVNNLEGETQLPFTRQGLPGPAWGAEAAAGEQGRVSEQEDYRGGGGDVGGGEGMAGRSKGPLRPNPWKRL